MMRIQRSYVDAVIKATCADDLLPLVQDAIKLEHATIPPYLCGYFTLKLGTNEAVGDIIRSVVIEEMLHMTIASNLLIALGGNPQINVPGFVPQYPGPLPMDIGDGLVVHLRKCSIDQVRDVFMGIEEPEDPIDIPTARALLAGRAVAEAEPPAFETIGAFYHHLAMKIEELGQAAFKPDPVAGQIVATQWFPHDDEMFAITGPETAKQAIAVIVDQGEGTSTDPFDTDGEPAHYYRFQEIVKGRELVRRPGETPPFAYAGPPVVLDAASVWDMDDDPRVENYRPGSRSRRMADQFNYSYTMLLNALHRAFNGEPHWLGEAMGVMFELRLLAQQVLETPAEWADVSRTDRKQTGLCFQYQPINR